MIYKFTIISDENNKFAREIEIDPESSFLDFQDAILDSVGYTKDQMTSFFICSEDWSKEIEITLIDMGSSADEDSYVMADTRIEELVTEKGQRLLFVFDNIADRMFFIEFRGAKSGTLIAPVCTLKAGDAPQQILDLDLSIEGLAGKSKKSDDDFFTDDYDEEGFNDDELEDLNIDDNYFENQSYDNF